MSKPRDTQPQREPGIVRFLTRQARHLIQVAAIIGTHLGIRLVAHFADQKYDWVHLEGAWWVVLLEDTSAAFAVVGFVCTTGIDLIAEIVESARSAWGRIKTPPPAEPPMGRGKPASRR